MSFKHHYVFYLAIGFITFSVGIAACIFYTLSAVDRLESDRFQKMKQPESLSVGSAEKPVNPAAFIKNIKYGCKDEELVVFWERLDKNQFRKFRERELKRLKLPADFEKSWGVGEELDCSYFNGIEKEIDLNNDGVNELFVRGTEYMRDAEKLVFQKVDNQYKVILFEAFAIEDELLKHRTNGFPDIKEMSNWSGGGRGLRIYQFSAGKYSPKKCYNEDYWILRKGEMVELENSLISPAPCH